MIKYFAIKRNIYKVGATTFSLIFFSRTTFDRLTLSRTVANVIKVFMAYLRCYRHKSVKIIEKYAIVA
jgi:hypothetical protein